MEAIAIIESLNTLAHPKKQGSRATVATVATVGSSGLGVMATNVRHLRRTAFETTSVYK